MRLVCEVLGDLVSLSRSRVCPPAPPGVFEPIQVLAGFRDGMRTYGSYDYCLGCWKSGTRACMCMVLCTVRPVQFRVACPCRRGSVLAYSSLRIYAEYTLYCCSMRMDRAAIRTECIGTRVVPGGLPRPATVTRRSTNRTELSTLMLLLRGHPSRRQPPAVSERLDETLEPRPP